MSAYVVLDGPDGCGKSRQADLLVEWMRAERRDVLHLREPGSTPVGELLRQLLLDPATGALRPVTEALLFTAARAELVEHVIAPALARGQTVVSERCFTSTLVYQGLAPLETGVDRELLWACTRAAHGTTMPTRVFVLDVDYATSSARRAGGSDDRIEARGQRYHERVRAGFLELAAAADWIEVVDGAVSVELVQEDLRARVSALVGEAR